ncbi:hypothetical protein HK405_007469 [Cladochytrium tenue]|nr:hypothetical protein HK405_007469 [Cladochytrium tenue]
MVRTPAPGAALAHVREQPNTTPLDRLNKIILTSEECTVDFRKVIELVEAIHHSDPHLGLECGLKALEVASRKIDVAAAEKILMIIRRHEEVWSLRSLMPLLQALAKCGLSEKLGSYLAQCADEETCTYPLPCELLVLWKGSKAGAFIPVRSAEAIVKCLVKSWTTAPKSSPSASWAELRASEPETTVLLCTVLADLITADCCELLTTIVDALLLEQLPRPASTSERPAIFRPTRAVITDTCLESLLQYLLGRGLFGKFNHCLENLLSPDHPPSKALLLRGFTLTSSCRDITVAVKAFSLIRPYFVPAVEDVPAFEKALSNCMFTSNVDLAIRIVELMAKSKLEPGTWDFFLPLLELSQARGRLREFLTSLNMFFLEGYDGAATAVLRAFVSGIIDRCVASRLCDLAFWYHGVMVRYLLPRTRRDFSHLLRLLIDNDVKPTQAELVLMDAKMFGYLLSAAEVTVLSEYARRLGDSRIASLTADLTRSLQPAENSEWGQNLPSPERTTTSAEELEYGARHEARFPALQASVPVDRDFGAFVHRFTDLCASGRYKEADGLVSAARASRTPRPAKKAIQQLISTVERHPPVIALQLGCNLFGWGVEAGELGDVYSPPGDGAGNSASSSIVYLGGCRSMLELRLHLVRALEQLALQRPAVPARDFTLLLPVFLYEPGGGSDGGGGGPGATRRTTMRHGVELARQVKAQLETSFTARLGGAHVCAPNDKGQAALAVPRAAVLEFVTAVFGPPGARQLRPAFAAFREAEGLRFEDVVAAGSDERGERGEASKVEFYL